MQEAFTFDTRLGVRVLRPDIDWERYQPEERKQIRGRWILMCSGMTDRISELEVDIMAKLEEIYAANSDEEMHRINDEMMDIASAICDLNILARSVYEELNKVHF